MKTIVIVEIDHDKPLPDLAAKVAGRAYSMPGVDNANAWEPKPELREHIESERPLEFRS